MGHLRSYVPAIVKRLPHCRPPHHHLITTNIHLEADQVDNYRRRQATRIFLCSSPKDVLKETKLSMGDTGLNLVRTSDMELCASEEH